MADDRLRELERRFRASGSPEDEARWLLLRMRTGAVTGEAVELAAYVGSPAARLLRRRPTPDGWLVAPSDPRWPADVDPDRAPLPIEEACDATGFGDGIGRWGRQASVRAALGAVHALWPVWLTKNDWNDRVDDRRRPRRSTPTSSRICWSA